MFRLFAYDVTDGYLLVIIKGHLWLLMVIINICGCRLVLMFDAYYGY